MRFKSFYISIYTIIIFSINSPRLNAQIFDNEQNQPSLKWMQISTANFQILYPVELKSEAMRMGNTLEYIISEVAKSLGKRPRKITIILQNQGVVSNGFVQLAPRRSEFFTTPPQSFDTQDWLNSLAVHELRHVVQFDKIAGGLKRPFSEELALAIFGISLPPWFFEGDAVGIETTLTHAGRGRLPDWELTFKTNTLSRKKYSYSKNYFGSYKDFTPGYYQLGFFMTTKLKRDYGSGIIDSVMSRIARNPLRPYNLSSSVRKFTGMTTSILHDSTITELERLWTHQKSQQDARQYPTINVRKSTVPTNYLLPVRINPKEIAVLKTGLNQTPLIVAIDSSGNERKIIRIGYQTESNFTYASGKFVWDELRNDSRFQKRSFNVINSFDRQSGRYKQLTHRSRLFSPALSPDARKIVAVNIALDNEISLVELDAENGNRLQKYTTKENYILQTPSYNAEGTRVVAIAVSQQGSAIMELDTRNSSWRLITPFQHQQFSRPSYAGEQVIFKANFNGVSNIYRLAPAPIPFEVSRSTYGAANPSYDATNNSILFNNYHIKGYDVGIVFLDGLLAKSVSDLKDSFIDYAAPLASLERVDIFDSIPNKRYETKPYRKLGNLFYFHSLSPIAEENEFNNDLNVGLKLKSNNQLNTLDFYTGYQFNTSLRKSEYLAGFTFKHFYPILDVKFIDRARLAYSSSISGGTTIYTPVNWRERFLDAGIRVPFVANRLNKNLLAGLGIFTSYTSRYDVINRPARFSDRIKFPVKYQFYLNHNTQRSMRDITPRWGQNITLSYQYHPFETVGVGKLFRLQTFFFTPGLAQNHSLQTSFNYQNTNGIYRFNTDIPRVSGYSHLRPAPLRNTLLLDYRFPLFYPDAEIGPIAYIKRIRGGLFADFENIGKGNRFSPRTYGIELNSDMNLLRFYLPHFELSGKLIFVPETKSLPPLFELGFNYNL